MTCDKCYGKGWFVQMTLDESREPIIWKIGGKEILEYHYKREEVTCECRVMSRLEKEWQSWILEEQLAALDRYELLREVIRLEEENKYLKRVTGL